MACYSLLARSQQSLPDSARIRCPMPHETIRACGTIATTLRYVIFILTIFWHFYSINDSALHPARPAGLGPARDGGFHLRPAAAGWIAAAELLALACAASWLGQTIELRNKRRLTLLGVALPASHPNPKTLFASMQLVLGVNFALSIFAVAAAEPVAGRRVSRRRGSPSPHRRPRTSSFRAPSRPPSHPPS
jgi:hypothetical protein